MQKLTQYDFKRPSHSRYDEVVKALIEEGVPAVRLTRGEDFTAKMDGVQSGLPDRILKAGRRARTQRDPDHPEDVIVVGLWPEGEGPRKKRARAKATA